MTKGKGKKDKKSKKEKVETAKSTTSVVEPASPEPELPKDIRTVTICLENYRNIIPYYRIADMAVTAQYKGTPLGETPKIAITGDDLLVCEHEFKIEFDANSLKSLDQLLANPVTFTVTQFPGQIDEELFEQLQKSEENRAVEDNYESVVSLYECISGVPVEPADDITDGTGSPKRKKSKDKADGKKSGKQRKPSKDKKKSVDGSSKSSRESKSDKKGKKDKGKKAKKQGSEGKEVAPIDQPVIVGICVLDLQPLIFGNETFSQCLPIKPIVIPPDDHMLTYKNLPQLTVNVTVSQKLENLEPVFLFFTLESIYNMPSVMKNDVEYKVAAVIPSLKARDPIMFSDGSYTTCLQVDQMKRWPGLPKLVTNSNATLYSLEINPAEVKDKVDVDLASIMQGETPRIEFNTLHRILLSYEDCAILTDHIRKHGRLALEIYMTPKSTSTLKTTQGSDRSQHKGKQKSEKDGKKEGSKAKSESTTRPQSELSTLEIGTPGHPKAYLHLVAYINMSYLLNPGDSQPVMRKNFNKFLGVVIDDRLRFDRHIEQLCSKLASGCFAIRTIKNDLNRTVARVAKVRVACPLSTFQYHEAETLAGLVDSYFMPKPKVIKPQHPPAQAVAVKSESKPGKKDKKKSAGSKSSKSSKGSKRSKSSASKSDHGDVSKDLKDKLPPEPVPEPPPEPSVKVFSETGDRTFVIVELCISSPLVKKRSIEDLSSSLHELLPQRPQIPKVVLTTKFAEQYYREVIHQVMICLSHYYVDYVEERDKCICKSDEKADFITYLRRVGIHEQLLASLWRAVSMLDATKFARQGAYQRSDKAYQMLLSEIYVYLVSEMHSIVNTTVSWGRMPMSEGPLTSLDELLLYAKEATELRKYSLAERYYMERICRNENNPDYWFDYALFCLERKNSEKAFQCLQEALSYCIDHRNSLLLYAIFLADRNQRDEAETCFLTLLVQHSGWVEAWGVLYLFYQLIEKYEGTEMCIDMVNKYMDQPTKANHRDYFMASDELAWTCAVVPNTLFFRTACVLLKLRMFHWVENALSNEMTKDLGTVNYLLAVTYYYKEDFAAAFKKLELAKELHGADYAVTGLFGHCYIAEKKYEEANTEYYYLLDAYNRPEDMHLVYVNCAGSLQKLGCDQEARKLILIACKYNPTPYTWMMAGVLYYHEHDLISAEECFTEANMRDNRLPDIWGYLTLINLKMDRTCEAEICYKHALKNNLSDNELLQVIKAEMRNYYMKQK